MRKTLRERFSVRTFAMLLCAYIWILLGVGGFQDVSTPRPGVFHLLLSPELRGIIWMTPALFAVICAWSRRFSPIALGLLFGPPSFVMVSYGLSWVLYEIPGGNPGNPAGWYSAALYLALIGMVVLAALVPSKHLEEDA